MFVIRCKETDELLTRGSYGTHTATRMPRVVSDRDLGYSNVIDAMSGFSRIIQDNLEVRENLDFFKGKSFEVFDVMRYKAVSNIDSNQIIKDVFRTRFTNEWAGNCLFPLALEEYSNTGKLTKDYYIAKVDVSKHSMGVKPSRKDVNEMIAPILESCSIDNWLMYFANTYILEFALDDEDPLVMLNLMKPFFVDITKCEHKMILDKFKAIEDYYDVRFSDWN